MVRLPRLAGQTTEHLKNQLRAFVERRRGTNIVEPNCAKPASAPELEQKGFYPPISDAGPWHRYSRIIQTFLNFSALAAAVKSDDKYRCESAARRSEIRRLPLVETGGREQDLAIISVKPYIHLSPFCHFIEPDHALRGRGKVLSNVAASNDLLPYAFRHFVAPIHCFASMTTGWLEEEGFPTCPQLRRIVRGDKQGARYSSQIYENLRWKSPRAKCRRIRKQRQIALVGEQSMRVRVWRDDDGARSVRSTH